MVSVRVGGEKFCLLFTVAMAMRTLYSIGSHFGKVCVTARTADILEVFIFSVLYEVVLHPLDVFKYFCLSFQGVLNLLLNF